MIDTDRELLELAAKAAELKIYPTIEGEYCLALISPDGCWGSEHIYWNPLIDNADAFKLAIELGLIITPNYHVRYSDSDIIVFTELEDTPDFCSPTRRAIVKCAAEIGRNL